VRFFIGLSNRSRGHGLDVMFFTLLPGKDRTMKPAGTAGTRVLRWGLILLLMCVSSLPGYAQIQPPSGLVSWWPGDGNANDIADGNNGTLMGGATFVPGKVLDAFNFDGTGFVQIPDSRSLEPAQITIDAWIRPVFAGRPFQGSDTDTILEKLSGLTGYGLFVTMDTRPGSFLEQPPGLQIGTPAFFLNVNDAAQQLFSPSPLPNDGRFHHVAGTYDGAVMRLFIDGSEVATRPIGGSIVHALGAGAFIGRENVFGPRNSKAVIDEVEIFNRALFPTEIQAIVAADSAGKCKDDDHDCVPNDKDVCPETPAGEVVDASGCSINQLCPCQGPWKNHGEYVSCVDRTSDDFVAAGLITPAEREAIVSNAAQSSCGKE